MITYPNINPVAFHIGSLPVYWYGFMYLIGFVGAWLLGNYRARHSQGVWTTEQVSDLIFYGALGVVIGGRVGYMVFYNFSTLIDSPLSLFRTWEGGMSFHGGLLGVLIAMGFMARRFHKSFFDITDFLAPLAPLGLAAGRLGNFINGELWGRATDVPWGMVFPRVDNLVRHPSQLYEFFLEGVVMFIVLWCYSAKKWPNTPIANEVAARREVVSNRSVQIVHEDCEQPKQRSCNFIGDGRVSALFLLLYGCFRFIVEYFREPDAQWGLVLFNSMSMGQLLSIPLVLFGMILWWMSSRMSKTQRMSKTV